MEIWDIYDKDRVKTGKTMPREEFVKNMRMADGEYYLAVYVCVINSEGKMLVQQRQPWKIGWPGFWDITAGGAAASGETSREAAERELFEEMGIRADFSDARPHLTVYGENAFHDFYLLRRDVDADGLNVPNDEVAQAKWATRDEIFAMMARGSFVAVRPGIIDLCFDLLNLRGTLERDNW